jgi:hypothetical protein
MGSELDFDRMHTKTAEKRWVEWKAGVTKKPREWEPEGLFVKLGVANFPAEAP